MIFIKKLNIEPIEIWLTMQHYNGPASEKSNENSKNGMIGAFISTMMSLDGSKI